MQRALTAANEIKTIRERIAELHEREIRIKIDKNGRLASAWKDLLRPLLTIKAKHLKKDVDEFLHALRDQGRVDEQIARLQRALGAAQCTVCGQDLPIEKREALGAELGHLEGRRKEVAIDATRFSAANNELQRIRQLLESRSLEDVCRLESEATKINLEIAQLETRLAELEEEVRGHDTAEGARRRLVRDRLMQQVGVAKEELVGSGACSKRPSGREKRSRSF